MRTGQVWTLYRSSCSCPDTVVGGGKGGILASKFGNPWALILLSKARHLGLLDLTMFAWGAPSKGERDSPMLSTSHNYMMDQTDIFAGLLIISFLYHKSENK